MNRITISSRRFPSRQRQRSRRLELELLEARNLLSFTNVLVNNPAEDTIPKQDTQSETAIVLGANSNIVVAYNDTGAASYPTPLNPTFGGYSLSTNTGASFTDEGQFPAGQPYWAGYDPVLASSSKTGTILMSINNVDTDAVAQTGGAGERIIIYRSLDNGQTFSRPINGTPGFIPGVDISDKPWLAVDNYPGQGYGNAYLAWTNFGTNLVAKAMYFTRSTDDGETWGPSGGITIQAPKLFGGNSTNFSGANVTVGPDHAVYVFWWDNTQNASILMRKSTDLGQTFSDPVTVTGLKTHGYHGDLGLTDSAGRTFTTNAFPQAAVNPVTGDIYIVYDDQGHGSQDKADIYFTMSSDGGNTWSKSVRVNDDNTYNDQWQPAIAVTPDGSHIGIFWYDRRLDPANYLIDRYGAIGTVAGHTINFAPNFRITDVSFPPAFGQDPYVGSRYMGDYDMATADNNYFYTTWGDNRLGDQWFANQPDVRFAAIPVGGFEGSSVSLTSGALATGASDPAGAAALSPAASTLISTLGPSSLPPDELAALEALFANLTAAPASAWLNGSSTPPAQATAAVVDNALGQWFSAQQAAASSGSLPDALASASNSGTAAQLADAPWSDFFATLALDC